MPSNSPVSKMDRWQGAAPAATPTPTPAAHPTVPPPCQPKMASTAAADARTTANAAVCPMCSANAFSAVASSATLKTTPAVPKGAPPICANSECRACRDDDECARRPGDRNQCVNGRCEVCDNDPILISPGCDAGRTPRFGADATCVACTNNAECRRGLLAGAPNACDRARGRCTGCDPRPTRAVTLADKPPSATPRRVRLCRRR